MFDSLNNTTPITNTQLARPRICMYCGPTPQGDTYEITRGLSTAIRGAGSRRESATITACVINVP